MLTPATHPTVKQHAIGRPISVGSRLATKLLNATRPPSCALRRVLRRLVTAEQAGDVEAKVVA